MFAVLRSHPNISNCVAAELFGRKQQQDCCNLTKHVEQPGAGQDLAPAFTLHDQNLATITTNDTVPALVVKLPTLEPPHRTLMTYYAA